MADVVPFPIAPRDKPSAASSAQRRQEIIIFPGLDVRAFRAVLAEREANDDRAAGAGQPKPR